MDLHLIARDGVFSTSDAARLGLDRNALARLVRQGRCLRLTTGWYAVVDGDPPAREALHRLTAVAVGRALRGRAALSHHSCLVVAGLPTFAADLTTVHLT
jgi:predicted transcriptional regulator of viral defense system